MHDSIRILAIVPRLGICMPDMKGSFVFDLAVERPICCGRAKRGHSEMRSQGTNPTTLNNSVEPGLMMSTDNNVWQAGIVERRVLYLI